ncbi:HAD domain-containing protein [Chitinolyticbacter meiyuanensis]|uniref:HAD domain-containing protein n=1 Tax=Chitinolyticbacter meiyuanensis TaxID=682798 RepID=UPI0011E5A4ED|nr:HAD domain-containing protein [Chitinolyticbacter meiyuanensis]
MKVLFLDFDGVLNSIKTATAFGGYPLSLDQVGMFDQTALQLIRNLRGAGVSIVLSTTWRLFCEQRDIERAMGFELAGETPRSESGRRGEEIKAWLDANPDVTDYAIVDDDSDMLPEQLSRFVKTDAHEGLTLADFCRICTILGIDPGDTRPRERQWNKTGKSLDWGQA